jgi:hypothetical protein
MSAENPFAKSPIREVTAEDLGIPPEAEAPVTAPPVAENAPEIPAVESERAQQIGKQMESLSATGSRSAEKLRRIEMEADRHPEYFGGNPELSNQFWTRVQEKATELRTGPELMRKKEEFWDKWKKGSMITAGVGVLAGVAGAAWSAKYGFDHTYMKEVLGQSLNVPMVAGFTTAAIAEGSAGIGKLIEMLRGQKRSDLQDNLRRNKI